MTVFYPIYEVLIVNRSSVNMCTIRLEYIFVHALDLQSRESTFFENVDLFSGQKGTQ